MLRQRRFSRFRFCLDFLSRIGFKGVRVLVRTMLAFLVLFVTSFSPLHAQPSIAAKHDVDIKSLIKELEEVERQMTDLLSKHERLLKDIEGLKILARRN